MTGARSSETNGLLAEIERARAAIVDETRALRAGAAIDHAEHKRRKDLSLLELTRRSRRIGAADVDPSVRLAIRGLRDAIIENQSVLRIHIDAARAIADVVTRAIVAEESDRTYSELFARRASR